MERQGKGFLDQLGQFFGQNNNREQEYRDFEQRYRQDPSQISDAEAAQRYREMMGNMRDDDPDSDFADDQVFGQMPQQDRRAMAQYYQDATRDPQRPYQGYPEDLDLDQAAQPQNLGRMTRRAAREDGDLLEQLVGPNSPLNSPAAKMALAGGAAYLASKYLSGRR